jgi:predicted metal-dependent phosphotriesterase family hydrolase
MKMDQKLVQGKVQTVLGLVDSAKLGFTITHEHILSDARGLIPLFFRFFFRKMSNNLNKTNVDNSVREAMLFKVAGGGTFVANIS